MQCLLLFVIKGPLLQLSFLNLFIIMLDNRRGWRGSILTTSAIYITLRAAGNAQLGQDWSTQERRETKGKIIQRKINLSSDIFKSWLGKIWATPLNWIWAGIELRNLQKSISSSHFKTSFNDRGCSVLFTISQST